MNDKLVSMSNQNSLQQTVEQQQQRINELETQLADTQRQHDILQQIISLLPNHVYWKDKNGYYLGCNDQQAHSLNLDSSQDIIGKHDRELNWQSGLEEMLTLDQQVMTSGEHIQTEEYGTLPDGTSVVYYSSKRPLRDPNSDEIFGLLGISVEITELKTAERQTSLAVIDAVEKLVFKFAGEMRTPLLGIESGLKGILQLLAPLVDAYKLAIEQQLLEESITKQQLTALAAALANLIPQTRRCHTIIDKEVNAIQQRRKDFATLQAKIVES